MKQILIVFFSLLSFTTPSSSPTWTANPLLNSGEHKPIYNGSSTSPSTFSYPQTFDTAFNSPPRVVLSLEGYKQDAPPNSSVDVGFHVVITDIQASTFTQNVTVYGTSISLLYYMYMGVDYSASEYFTSFQELTFSSGNLADGTSSSREYWEVKDSGTDFTNYGTNQIRLFSFLSGFLMNMGTKGTFISLYTDMINSTHYNLTISTQGDVQIYQASYFLLSFDETQIQSTYESFFDLGIFEGRNSSQIIYPSNLTVDSFMYRNYLMGFVDIQINDVSLQRDFLLQLVGTPQTIYDSTYSNPTYQYLYALVFHHRLRVCNSSQPYYYPVDELCYASCPTYYYEETSGDYCASCHYTCLTCQGANSSSCSSCDNSTYRVLENNSTCDCDTGYFDNNTAVCEVCDSLCLTCQTSSSNCISCNTTANRELSSNTCICKNGYKQTNGECELGSGICGDGFIDLSEECDDANTANSDGCSSSCSVEQYHECSERSNGTSLCYYARQITMQIQSIIKEQYQNQISIIMNVVALGSNENFFKEYFESLRGVQISDSRRRMLGERILQSEVLRIISTEYNNNILNLIIQYYEDVASLSNKRISFVSSSESSADYLTYFFNTPTTSINLQQPHNNLPIIYYQSSSYQLVESLTNFYIAIVSFHLLFFVMGVISRKTAIAVQSLLLTQISWAFLLGQENVEIGFSGLGIVGKYLMFYNANFLDSEETCFGMQAISLQCNSIDNINITAYIAIICLLVCLGFKGFQLKKQKQCQIEAGQSSSEQSSRQTNPPSIIPTTPPPSSYSLPPTVKMAYCILNEIFKSIFFILVICFWATICYQDSVSLVGSIVWDTVLSLAFTGVWLLWFLNYGWNSLSFWDIMVFSMQKLSIYKVYYLILFSFLSILGILLALVVGYAAYSFAIVFSIFAIVLIIKKTIYRQKANQIRSIINYGTLIAVSLIYIIADAVDIGDGIAASIALSALLFLSCLANIGFWAYIVYIQRKYKQKESSLYDSEHEKELKKKNQELKVKDTPMKTERKIPLLDGAMKTLVKEKVSELKAFKMELKMELKVEGIDQTDEQKAKENISETFRFAHTQRKQFQQQI